MNTTVRLEVPVRRPSSRMAIHVIVGFALVSAVFALFCGLQANSNQSTVAFSHTAIPVSLAITAGLLALAFVVHRQTIKSLVVDHSVDGTTTLRIGEQVMTGPAQLVYGYCPGERINSSLQKSMLWCDVHLGAVMAIRLVHQLGTISSPPDHWELQQPSQKRNPEFGHFSCRSVAMLVEKITSLDIAP